MDRKPSLYYPGGGGGNWLNYLVWCSEQQTNVLDVPKEFGATTKGYRYFRVLSHQDYTKPADIWFGSERAYINYYINVVVKNPSWDKAEPGGYIRMRDHVWHWNLDYAKIFFEPEGFLEQLNSVTGFNLRFDQYTKLAFEQYRESCPWWSMPESELLKTQWVTDSWRYCYEHRTNINDTVEVRTQQAWEETRSCLLIGRPND